MNSKVVFLGRDADGNFRLIETDESFGEWTPTHINESIPATPETDLYAAWRVAQLLSANEQRFWLDVTAAITSTGADPRKIYEVVNKIINTAINFNNEFPPTG